MDPTSKPTVVTHVSLPIEVVNRALGYLVTRPYAEVYEIIPQITAASNASFKEQRGEGDKSE